MTNSVHNMLCIFSQEINRWQVRRRNFENQTNALNENQESFFLKHKFLSWNDASNTKNISQPQNVNKWPKVWSWRQRKWKYGSKIADTRTRDKRLRRAIWRRLKRLRRRLLWAAQGLRCLMGRGFMDFRVAGHIWVVMWAMVAAELESGSTNIAITEHWNYFSFIIIL